MHTDVNDNVDATGLRIGIAVSRYHHEITQSMRDAAVETFMRCGGRDRDLLIVESPGTFELTAICRALALLQTHTQRAALDAIVALGCVITGQTTHDRYIAQSVTQGLTAISVQTGAAISFGILTCQTLDQARARSIEATGPGRSNKGAQAMIAAIETARTIKAIESCRGFR